MSSFLAPTPSRPTTGTQKASWIAIAVTIVGLFEGLSLTPYFDSVHVKTVCYGATAADHVDLTKTYTKTECQDMLANDLPKYDAEIKKCLTPAAYAALPPNRHAAMVSFTYNVGGGAFCKSSVARDLNKGKITAACNSLLLYNRGGGRVIAGLTTRRKDERTLCLKDN